MRTCVCVYRVTAHVRGEPIVYDFFIVKNEKFHINIIYIEFLTVRAIRTVLQAPTIMSIKC